MPYVRQMSKRFYTNNTPPMSPEDNGKDWNAFGCNGGERVSDLYVPWNGHKSP